MTSVPRAVAGASLTLAAGRALSGSLRYRHVGRYRLDEGNPIMLASGLDVVDLSLNVQVGRRLAVGLSVDNLTDARYFETQNWFESRLRPGDDPAERVHGTPGYPRTVTLGLTLRLGGAPD